MPRDDPELDGLIKTGKFNFLKSDQLTYFVFLHYRDLHFEKLIINLGKFEI